MKLMRNLLRISGAGTIFAAGYFCGALLQPAPADAQIGDLMKQATGASDVLGSAARLGTTITEMQKNVDALNENLKVLNEVKASLGG